MKKIIMFSICSFLLLLSIGILGINYYSDNNKLDDVEGAIDYDYTYDILDTPTMQVNNSEDTIIRPYKDTSVKIVKGFYDYKGNEDDQRNSLIYYDNTYMQSMGVCYGSDKEFDIVSILDGEVTELTADELVGNSITIKHNDTTYSIYQSIKDINVKKGDYVTQGQKLGVSSVSNIDKDLNNHVYFELVINNSSVNPEEYYDNTL